MIPRSIKSPVTCSETRAMNTTTSRGFTALVSVMLLVLGTIAYALTTLAAAAQYADSIGRREMRIQANLDAESCMDIVTLMVAKDYFLSGTVPLPEYGCTGVVMNDFLGNVAIDATTIITDVVVRNTIRISL